MVITINTTSPKCYQGEGLEVGKNLLGCLYSHIYQDVDVPSHGIPEGGSLTLAVSHSHHAKEWFGMMSEHDRLMVACFLCFLKALEGTSRPLL